MNEINYIENKKERRICKKIHSIENAKYKKSLLQLKQQESFIEKSVLNITENITSEVVQLVLHDMNDIAKKREVLLRDIRMSLGEINDEFESVKSTLNHPRQIQNLDHRGSKRSKRVALRELYFILQIDHTQSFRRSKDTNAFKQRLVRLSQRIQDFEKSCRYESLLHEQTTLECELREFESTLHKYQNVTRSDVNKSTFAASSKKTRKSGRNYRQAQEFYELIAKTGRTGNWSDEDHLLFLKMRQKCSNVPVLVAAIRAKCPDLTAGNIVNHEAWYKAYLSLREKQRSTVKEWRERKETEKAGKVCEDETEQSHEKSNSDIAEELVPRTAIKHETKATTLCNVVDIDRCTDRKKELIRRWKVEREEKRSTVERQSKILMESKLAVQEKRKRERLQGIQVALAEYREKKLTTLSAKVSKDNLKIERKCDPAMIEAFRKQDEEYVRRRKNMIASLREPSAKNLTMRIARSQALQTRDCSTLLNPTVVWSERCKMQDSGARELKKLQYIKDVPRLYVQWRNKESI